MKNYLEIFFLFSLIVFVRNLIKTNKINKKKMEEKSNEKEYFEFKIDVLKIELEHIHNIVASIDTLTQVTKNWTIAIWSGGIALALSSNDIELKKFIIITAIVPLLFWFIDANYRKRQRKFLYRLAKISDFLNSERLKKSFDEKDIVGFHIMDPIGRKYKNEPELEEFADLFKAFKFRSLRFFYLGLITISIILSSIFWIQSIARKSKKIEQKEITNSKIDSLIKVNQILKLEIEEIKNENGLDKKKETMNKTQNNK